MIDQATVLQLAADDPNEVIRHLSENFSPSYVAALGRYAETLYRNEYRRRLDAGLGGSFWTDALSDLSGLCDDLADHMTAGDDIPNVYGLD